MESKDVLENLRKDYRLKTLNREDLNPDPTVQFNHWFQEVLDNNLMEPNAMVLSTVDSRGYPASRTVLLKGLDDRGFRFYTNSKSRKGRELEHCPAAALLFLWLPLERQVRIEGEVTQLPREETANYFHSRPRGSQLSAWTSPQSQIIPNRQTLEEKYHQLEEKFAQNPIPLPDFWTGYTLKPNYFEFWQGRANRSHDRFEYRAGGDSSWEVNRLAP